MNELPIDNSLSKETWEKMGEWWDDNMDEGDIFHRYLVHPNVLRQLELTSDDNVLDLACGNGALTRKISHAIQKPVFGIDFSSTLLNRAKKRDAELGFQNIYRLGDLMDNQALNHYQDKKINKAVCSLALHDIEDITPLTENLASLLPKGGYVVIAVLHPCLNSGNIGLANANTKDIAVMRSTYIKSIRLLSCGKENQPQPHPHFHRSLSVLMNDFFSKGFLLDKCDEPIFSVDELSAIGPDFLWAKMPEISPVLILRFRR